MTLRSPAFLFLLAATRIAPAFSQEVPDACREGDFWFLQRTYASPAAEAVDFGASVYVTPATIVVGDALYGSDSAKATGRAYLYPGANLDDDGSSPVEFPIILGGEDSPQDRRLLGFSVAVSGNTIVAGAPGDSSVVPSGGVVYVFSNNQATYSVQTAETPTEDDGFGYIVDIDQDVLIVGSRSGTAVYLFERASMMWSLGAILEPDGTQNPSEFVSVAIAGSTVVVGDTTAASAGAVFVYRLVAPGSWLQQAKLQASDRSVGDGFGTAVAIHRDTIVVGAHESSGRDGAAYVFIRVFENDTFQWIEQAKLLPDDSLFSEDFGFNVAIYDDTIIVADDVADSELFPNVGFAYVFVRTYNASDEAVWTLQQRLQSPAPFSREGFAASVSIDDGIIVVGSSPRDVSGQAFVYVKCPSNFTESPMATPPRTPSPTMTPMTNPTPTSSVSPRNVIAWTTTLLGALTMAVVHYV